MAQLKRAQCLVCCRMYDTYEEAGACTHKPDEPDEAAAFLVSPAWGLARLFKRHSKEVLDEALAQHAQLPATTEADPAERLRKLTELHQGGLLTDEEFATKRAAIVDQL